ncbi:MlaD family protein [Fodinicola feengrottensis]|uniref:MlaD family protein n=1 Tax=Fodinicola feengrottensis TaxID=435914 RepID=A0ABN2G4S7_9ACTN|nr:MlaD family protein [Fodinicola feengrottensis]
MNRRSPVVRLVIFTLLGAICTAYVGVQLFGVTALRGTIQVTIRMADASGLVPQSLVTYRGARVGIVQSVGLNQDDAGVAAVLSIDATQHIPANARAVIDMDTPIDIQHVDLQPQNTNAPYLANGSVIQGNRISTPLPLETLLVHLMTFADSINTHDVATLTNELSTGLSGMGPDLRHLLDNLVALLRSVQTYQPQLLQLIGNTNSLLNPANPGSVDLPALTSALQGLTSQVRSHSNEIGNLLDQGTGVANQLVPLLQDNQESFTTLLGNTVTTSQIISIRTAAINELLISLPDTFTRVGGIAHGDTAFFSLLAAQGPVCYYNTPRRTPTDTSVRPVQPNYLCNSTLPDLQQRGSQNVPSPQRRTTGTYDPATGNATDPTGQQFRLGTNGGQASAYGSQSWSAILLQGVQ